MISHFPILIPHLQKGSQNRFTLSVISPNLKEEMSEGKFQDYDLLITNIVTIKTRKLIYNKTIQIAFYPQQVLH